MSELNKIGTSESDTITLTVLVTSFSYRKGYPTDPSGNGGGFVFDCRCMHNPGRYEEYRHLTGRDKEVIDFLEQKGEVFSYLEDTQHLVDMAVIKYLNRGFSNLAVSFGCTGGRHRSVYCAESIARYIKRQYPSVKVILCHREQEITAEL